MKNVARACFFGCSVFAAVISAVACWPLAPKPGGDQDAAAGSEGGETTDSQSPYDGTIMTENDAGEDAGSPGDSGVNAADATLPVFPSPSVSIAEGVGFGCYIAAGNVFCWGNNTYGQAGSPPSVAAVAHPQQVSIDAGAIAIALGDSHACAVTSMHAVYCWGNNDAYQLGRAGDGDAGDWECGKYTCNPVPQLINVPTAVGIAAAGAWTCIVATDGTVDCWGAIQDGTQGSTTSIPCGAGTCYPPPNAISGVSGVKQLAVAFDHACALMQDGAVSCWGNNSEDQVSQHYCPQACSPNLPPAASVAVGTSFSCALLTDGGAVSCFGDNAYGELGHPPGDNDFGTDGGFYNGTPLTVQGLAAASELVAAGSQAACALVGAGTVECWGNITSDAAAGVPVAISDLPTMNSLGVPDSTYACGVATDGGIWCWYLVDVDGGAPIQVR